jgi:hypothetical protein
MAIRGAPAHPVEEFDKEACFRRQYLDESMKAGITLFAVM